MDLDESAEISVEGLKAANGLEAALVWPTGENKDLEAPVEDSVEGFGANKDDVEVDEANNGFVAEGFGAKKEAVELPKVVEGANEDFAVDVGSAEGLGANTEAGLLEAEFDADAWGLKENPWVSSFSFARRAASFSS